MIMQSSVSAVMDRRSTAKLAPWAGVEPAASFAPDQTVPSARTRFPDQDADGSRHRQRDHGESRVSGVFVLNWLATPAAAAGPRSLRSPPRAPRSTGLVRGSR